MQILEMFIFLLFQWAIQLCKQAAVENIGTNSIVMINNHFYKFWFLFLNLSTKRLFCLLHYLFTQRIKLGENHFKFMNEK